MRVSFLSQPYADGRDLEGFLLESFRDTSFNRLDAAVAWAKRSGLGRLEGGMREFRMRGGTIRLIIGISEGGATAQGLQMVAELADEAYVFHVHGRTFHPKVYAFSGPHNGAVFVGSHNLTRGGLLANFEAATLNELDLGIRDDSRLLADVRSFLDRLVADTAVCRSLDAQTVETLINDRRYRVSNEDAQRAATDSTLVDSDEGSSLFGSSEYSLRSVNSSGASRTSRPSRERPGSDRLAETGDDAYAYSGEAQPQVLRRWSKKIPRSDAQRLPGKSNPSGHLTLTQAGNPIDQATYFRNTFFAGTTWNPVTRTRERATIEAHVVILGRNFGRLSLDVDHNPAFQSDQRNRATTLRWGALNDYLRRLADVTDCWITVEALSNGTYRLTIAESPLGPFIR
ncbi:MAG TPA: phospholipase D family protein [Gaiellaceae bacterium]|nr:phospholipase D family protein [Gaiellaceae bacterium]